MIELYTVPELVTGDGEKASKLANSALSVVLR
jgi:hypothetical protein